MRTYILRRVLQTIPLLFGISLLTFLLLQLAPGDFLNQMAENPGISAATIDAMRVRFGLDQPWYVQYGKYLQNVVFHFDFGQSFSRHQPVVEVLHDGFINTLLLAGAAAVITWGLAIPLGMLAAVRQHSWVDRLLSLTAFVWLSVPEILAGLVVLMFAARTGWFPVGGMHSLDYDELDTVGQWLDIAHHLVLPALVVGLIPLASRMRQMRGSLLDVLRLDYVTTARSKGLSERTVIVKHALRNALNPMITLFGYTLGALVSGSFIVEIIFSWPGLGRITLDALLTQDQYLVMGAVLMAAVVLIAGNLVADLLLAIADPRISYDSLDPELAVDVLPPQSPGAIFWTQMKKSPLAIAGGGLLALFYLMALFAPFIAPYTQEAMDRQRYFHPPQSLHWIHGDGHFSLRPFVRDTRLADRETFEYAEDPATEMPIRFFVRGYDYQLFGLIPSSRHLFGVDPPGRFVVFGTDSFGRDVLSRLLYGAQISLTVGLVGIAISFTLGLLLGGVAGYFGGFADTIIMRVTELLLSIPSLYLIIALRAIFPVDLPSRQIYLGIVGILAFIGWAGLARVIRGLVLSMRKSDFVAAAEALGFGRLRIIARHVLPNTMSYVIVAATLSIPGYILGEVVLSFLGVGVQEPSASWGNMLNQARSIRALTSFPWLLLVPGTAIFLTVMAFNFLGDGLRDALDPRRVSGGKA